MKWSVPNIAEEGLLSSLSAHIMVIIEAAILKREGWSRDDIKKNKKISLKLSKYLDAEKKMIDSALKSIDEGLDVVREKISKLNEDSSKEFDNVKFIIRHKIKPVALNLSSVYENRYNDLKQKDNRFYKLYRDSHKLVKECIDYMEKIEKASLEEILKNPIELNFDSLGADEDK